MAHAQRATSLGSRLRWLLGPLSEGLSVYIYLVAEVARKQGASGQREPSAPWPLKAAKGSVPTYSNMFWAGTGQLPHTAHLLEEGRSDPTDHTQECCRGATESIPASTHQTFPGHVCGWHLWAGARPCSTLSQMVVRSGPSVTLLPALGPLICRQETNSAGLFLVFFSYQAGLP